MGICGQLVVIEVVMRPTEFNGDGEIIVETTTVDGTIISIATATGIAVNDGVITKADFKGGRKGGHGPDKGHGWKKGHGHGDGEGRGQGQGQGQGQGWGKHHCG